jgi:hypothetical protein
VGKQDVHRGPNGCLGEQTCHATNLAGPPGLLHGEVAGVPPVLAGNEKHSRFKDAALAAQEQAAAAEEGKTTAMKFALLQEQHKHQMEAMAASSQKAMDAMMERMNALIAGQGKAADKENTPPVKDNAHSGTRGTKRNKKKCTHCGKHLFHKSVDCYKLKVNASKCWTGWKSVIDNSRASA